MKQKNRILSLLLTVSFAFAGVSVPVNAKEFTDVSPEDSFYTAVQYVSDNGIMNGVSDTEFAPFDKLTRAMFVTMLHRMSGEKYVNYAMPFSDVPADEYYTEAVRWASAEKIVTGTSETQFSPDEYVTHEQVAALIYRYDEYRGEDVKNSYNPTYDKIVFKDFKDVDAYAEQPMRYCISRAYVVGNADQLILPQADTNRSEAAAVFMRVKQYGAPDYADMHNWAIWNRGTDKKVDVFMISPTIDKGRSGNFNSNINHEYIYTRMKGAVEMDVGIFADDCNIYSPLYRQSTLTTITENGLPCKQEYWDTAYGDIKRAFEYYIENSNSDRPIILMGYSQGAQMGLQLMKDYFGDEKYADRLVASYLIGWRLTEDEVKEYPHLKPAESETDTGVIITYDCEDKSASSTPIIPEGYKSYSINPLNWKTNSEPADKALNKGACKTDYSGAVTEEIPNLTGAYIDETRGALIATDVTPEQCPDTIFGNGSYHSFDVMFFYRNLQENVKKRIEAFGVDSYTPPSKSTSASAPYVAPEMLSAEYWIDNSDRNVVLDENSIKALNEKIIKTPECNMNDLKNMPSTFDGIFLKNELAKFDITADLYINGVPVEKSFFDKVKANISNAVTSSSMPVGYGVCVNRTLMKAYPYAEMLSDSATDFEWDNYANSSVLVNEPLLVYFKTADNKFSYVRSECCSGWVPTDDIAICRDKAEWEKAVYFDNRLVITGEKVYLEPSVDKDISEKLLTMGTTLEICDTPDAVVTHRLPWCNYVVNLPQRDENGKYYNKQVLIPYNRDISMNYVPYTNENVLELAFKSLGNRYGWGGMLHSQDCSSYVREIYLCFGLKLPRNTTWQGEMPVEITSLENKTVAEKGNILKTTPPGAIVQFKGHEMIYLGESGGRYYVISDVSSLINPENPDGGVIRPRSVVVTDLSILRSNGNTWMDDLNKVIVVK